MNSFQKTSPPSFISEYVLRVYSYIYWACARSVKMHSSSDQMVKWKARTMIYCMNVQFCMWIWPLTEIISKRRIEIGRSYAVMFGALILVLNQFVLNAVLKNIQADILLFEEYTLVKKRISDGLVVATFVLSFFGFIVLSGWSKGLNFPS